MKLLIANWKMAPETPAQAKLLAKATAAIARTHKKNVAFVACVPFVHLTTVAATARTLVLGAQDVSAGLNIASTGQVSAGMLKSLNAAYCIIGHSESRARGDTNELVKAKLERLLEKKIQIILCVGEKSRDVQGWYLSEIKDQIETALLEVPKAALKRLIIAYEPLWAIGSAATRVATPAECREMIIFIRKLLTDLSDEKTARAVPILYGGSVDEENAASFITEGEAGGLLVGRVSLAIKQLAVLAKSINF